MCEPTPTWPILARIAEIAEQDPPTATSDAKSYRVDSPHAAAMPPARPLQRSGTSEPGNPEQGTDTAERQERVLAFAPLPIRLTVQAWRRMQPYLGIIRFAAMLALMAIGGTSMTLMMGGFWHPADAPPSSGATTADQTSALQMEPSAIEPNRRVESTTPPDAKSTSIAPTAVGPASAESKRLMAIEPGEPAAETPPSLAVAPDSTAVAELPAWPTKPDHAATQSIADSEPWPQVQPAAPAIATLKGVVIETQTR